MSTRSVIAFKPADVKCNVGMEGRYCHYDGFPVAMLPTLDEIAANLGAQGLMEAVTAHNEWRYLEADTSDAQDTGNSVVADGVGMYFTDVEGRLFDLTFDPDERTIEGIDLCIEWVYLIDPITGTVEVFEPDYWSGKARYRGAVTFGQVTKEAAQVIQDGKAPGADRTPAPTVKLKAQATWTEYVKGEYGFTNKDRSRTKNFEILSLEGWQAPKVITIDGTPIRQHPLGHTFLIPLASTWETQNTYCRYPTSAYMIDGRLTLPLRGSVNNAEEAMQALMHTLKTIVFIDGEPWITTDHNQIPALHLEVDSHGYPHMGVSYMPGKPRTRADEAYLPIADYEKAAEIAQAIQNAGRHSGEPHTVSVDIHYQDVVRDHTEGGADAPSEALERLTACANACRIFGNGQLVNMWGEVLDNPDHMEARLGLMLAAVRDLKRFQIAA